ncbi:hypothetical protein ACJIZ3_010247 [Penstemon smallii]|uniref:SAM domain-containing protein n=1 Tax=Penstemon smallii TaxID=265156 RepID=A0ABD3TFY7_9LAMI
MEWYTWLSKTTLDPSLVYDYALTFTNNDLELDDIPYFSHEFLQSMGISIAKHRLEILKVARKEKGERMLHPVLWLMFAIKQTKKYISKHIKELVHRENSKLAIVPKRNNSLRWKVTMLQRNKKLKAAYLDWPTRYDSDPAVECGRDILMLTNGSPMVESQSSCSTGNSSSAELKANFSSTKEVHSRDGEYWSSSMEEIKWDSMFKNLKPT